MRYSILDPIFYKNKIVIQQKKEKAFRCAVFFCSYVEKTYFYGIDEAFIILKNMISISTSTYTQSSYIYPLQLLCPVCEEASFFFKL